MSRRLRTCLLCAACCGSRQKKNAALEEPLLDPTDALDDNIIPTTEHYPTRLLSERDAIPTTEQQPSGVDRRTMDFDEGDGFGGTSALGFEHTSPGIGSPYAYSFF